MMGVFDRLRQVFDRRASTQTAPPRDPVIADWFAASSMSAAGMSVTADSAMRVAAVFSCVRVLSESIAALPLILYRRTKDGGKERATDHPLSALIKRPNGWQTRFEFLEQATARMLLSGAGYSRIVADARGMLRLIPLQTRHLTPKILDSGRIAYEYRPQSGQREILLQEEVLRVPFMCVNDIEPISVIAAQRESIGASLAAQDYGSRFFANDARPTGGFITWETGFRFKDDDEEKKFRQSWQQYMTGANRHKTAFLKSGMKFNELGMSNEDAQFLDTRKFQRSEIAGIFHVPPHMIGDLERATFSNIEHQSIDFVIHTIGPLIARFEQAMSRDLLSDAEQDEYFFEFLTAGLMRGDSKARAEYLKTAISQGGWMNRNEARAIENMNRVDGLDEFIVPLNMGPADLLAEQVKEKLE